MDDRMFLNCAICTEKFNLMEDVSSTACGHIFHKTCLGKWLNRSATCPQCRDPLSNRKIFRIYLNGINFAASQNDIQTLRNKVKTAETQLNQKDMELRSVKEQLKHTKKTQNLYLQQIIKLEKKQIRSDILLASYRHKIMNDDMIIKNFRKEFKYSKSLIDSVLTSGQEANHASNNSENDPREWILSLQEKLEKVQRELRASMKVKRHCTKLIRELENENFRLNKKLSNLSLLYHPHMWV